MRTLRLAFQDVDSKQTTFEAILDGDVTRSKFPVVFYVGSGSGQRLSRIELRRLRTFIDRVLRTK